MSENIIADLAHYVGELDMNTKLASLFTLSASPVFGLLATGYLRELEDIEIEQGSGELTIRHGGPVTKASLTNLAKNGGVYLTWDEYRLGVLGHLEQHGMDGVGKLMHNSMTTLMKRA
jgi:centromere protein I